MSKIVLKAFSTIFEFIWAHFDTSDIETISRSPAKHILEAFRKDMFWLKSRQGKLTLRKRVLEVVGRAAFYSEFIRNGRTYMYSCYAAIAVARRFRVIRTC